MERMAKGADNARCAFTDLSNRKIALSRANYHFHLEDVAFSLVQLNQLRQHLLLNADPTQRTRQHKGMPKECHLSRGNGGLRRTRQVV